MIPQGVDLIEIIILLSKEFVMKDLPILFFAFLLFLFLTPSKVYSQTHYYITSSDQTELYVQEFGSGESIILLAGGPLNANYMKAVWENLSMKYHCIILDQRGTGKSLLAQVDSSSLSITNYINDLEVLRKKLELEQVTLIGHSWGGMLAMEYTSQYPERVKKLILLGTGGPTSKFYSYFSDNITMRLHEDDLIEKAVLDSLKRNNLSAVWPGYFFDRKKGLETKENIDFEKLLGQEGIYSFVFTNYLATEDVRINRLRNYTGPVRIIQGRQDPIGESTVYEIKEILPQSQIYFIEQCGHFPWFENQDQKTEFFDQLDKSILK